MRIKLILAILLCLFAGCISGVGAGSGGSVSAAPNYGPCAFWINGLYVTMDSYGKEMAYLDHTDPNSYKAIKKNLINMHDYYEHVVTCTRDNGLPCKGCREAQRIFDQQGRSKVPEITNDLPADFNDNLIRMLLLQADHHGSTDKNFTMYLGHPVSKELSNLAAKKWLGQGYAKYYDPKGNYIG